jgi:hypothetical protein
MKAEQLTLCSHTSKRNIVLQDAQIRVIRPNWCIQEHTSGIIDSSNSRGQFSYSTKIELYQAFNHRTSYVIHKSVMPALNWGVSIFVYSRQKHCIKCNRKNCNVAWDWTSRMLNIIHLTELSSTGEDCWGTNIFCQDGLSHGNDQRQVIFNSNGLCQSHAV